MIHLIVGSTNPNCTELLNGIFRLRHDVFVKEMAWKIDARNGLEFDQFDTPDTLYLAELDNTGEVVATVRMNPASRPTLLSEVFPAMCENGAPSSPLTWELTRGAIAKRVRKSIHFGRIECATIEAALLWGITNACGLFGVDLLMKKIRAGLEAKPLGQPRMIDGESTVAAEFPMNIEVLKKTRALYRISGPSIERIHAQPAIEKAAA